MRKEAQPSVSSTVKIFKWLSCERHNVIGVSPCHWPGCGIIGEKLVLRSHRK